MKLPAHRAGLPGDEISFLFVPLDPAYKAGLAGHLPVKICTEALRNLVPSPLPVSPEKLFQMVFNHFDYPIQSDLMSLIPGKSIETLITLPQLEFYLLPSTFPDCWMHWRISSHTDDVSDKPGESGSDGNGNVIG